MPLDLRALQTPYQPLDFSPIQTAVQNIQAARFRNAQLQEQIRQADMQQQMRQQQLDAQVREQAAAQSRWAAEQEFGKEKHADLQAHRKAGLEDTDERNLLARQKATEQVLGKLRGAATENMSDAELEAFRPQLAALGLDMRIAAPHIQPSQVSLPNMQPGADPVAFAGQVEQAAGAATEPQGQARALEIMRGEEILQRIPLSQLRAGQQQAVSGALGDIASAAPSRYRPAYQGAASFAPSLRGTADEQIQQAVAIAHKQMGLDAAARAARRTSGGADSNRYDLQYERGVKQFERTMAKMKNEETVNKLTLFQEALEKLKPGPDGKINPSSAMEAFYGIATAREGGRLTEGDFQRSFGFQDLLTKAQNFLKTGFQAELSDQQIEWTVGMIKKNYSDAVKKMKRDHRAAERLMDRLPEGARKEGVSDQMETVFGELPQYEALAGQMQQESSNQKAQKVKSGRSLLKKYGGG